MADFDSLNNKLDDNDGDRGRLTAKEWNSFVDSVKGHESSINTLKNTAVKGVLLNGTEYNTIVDGIIQIGAISSDRVPSFTWIPDKVKPSFTIAKGSSIPVSFNVVDKNPDGTSWDGPGSLIISVIKLDGTPVQLLSYNNVSDGFNVTEDLGTIAKDYLLNEGLYKFKFSYTNSGASKEDYVNCNVIDLKIQLSTEFKDTYTVSDEVFPIIGARENAVLHYTLNGNTNSQVFGSDAKIKFDDIIKSSTHGSNELSFYVTYTVDNVEIQSAVQTYKYLYADPMSGDTAIMSNIIDNTVFDLYSNIDVNYTLYVTAQSGETKISMYLKDANDENVLSAEHINVKIENYIGKGTQVFSLIPKGDTTDTKITSVKKLVISFDSYDSKEIIPISVRKVEVPFKEVTDGLIVYLDADGKTNDQADKDTWKSTVNGVTYEMNFPENIEFLNGSSGWYYTPESGSSFKLKRGKYCSLNYFPFENDITYNGSIDRNGLTISIEFSTSRCFDDNAPVITCISDEAIGNDRGFVINTSNLLLSASNKQLTAKFQENKRLRVDFVIEGKLNKYEYKSYLPEDPDNDNYNQIAKNDVSNECLMLIYIDGVYAGIAEYSAIAKDLSFKQSAPQVIKFGSDQCELDIYKIRIYNRSLTIQEILSNYAFDANGFENKVNIAKRNDIFQDKIFTDNKPNIDKNKLATNLKDLPVFTVKLDDRHNTGKTPGELTNTKEEWQLCSFSKYFDANKQQQNSTVAKTSWEANTGTIRNQGTSSMNYPWPWRNWDWKTGDTDYRDGMDKDSYKSTFKYYFPDLKSTVKSSTWHQMDYGSNEARENIGLKKLTFKKDYASSEMCNNAICSELYTDFALHLMKDANYIGSDNSTGVCTPKMRNQYAKEGYTDYKLSLKAIPCFMFQELSFNKGTGNADENHDSLGMMNLIPNKNEVAYLGFSENKWEDEGSDKREQSWELVENFSGIYWKKFFNKASVDSEGRYVNDLVENYEARTPKDSVYNGDDLFKDKDFGHADDSILTQDQLKALIDQTEDLRRFHNWLVQIDKGTPTGLTLAELEARTLDARTYPDSSQWMDYINYDMISDLKGDIDYAEKYVDVDASTQIDNASWRARRFETESKNYLIKDQWLMYYLWREMLWMFDSGLKNLQIYTMDGNHWGCMVRDADTALGIENTGKDLFPPHLEDIDLYTVGSDGKPVFQYGIVKADAEKIIYNVDDLSNEQHEVLNGQFGSIWVHIRDSWKDDLTNMYKSLKSAGITSNYLIDKFRNHQEHWSEALYNFGMRQYCCGTPFLSRITSALGDKKHSRAQWLERGIYYRDGKYRAWDSSDASDIRLRLADVYVKDNTVEGGYKKVDNSKFKISTYIPTYFGCGGASSGIINIPENNNFRIIDINNDKNYSIEIPTGPEGINIQTSDANMYWYGTKYITETTELYKFSTPGEENHAKFNMPLLRKLEIGHEYERDNTKYYSKTTSGEYIEIVDSRLKEFSLNNLQNLTLFDGTNRTMLSSLPGLNKCNQLEALYLRGTAFTTLDLPSTSTLHTLYLSSNMQSLDFNNLTNLGNLLEDGTQGKLVIPNYSNITRINIKNCSNYLKTESLNIVKNCIDNNGFKECKITGISWGNQNTPIESTLLEKIIALGKENYDISGTIYVDNMSTQLKTKLIEKFGTIDDPNGTLFISYTRLYVDASKSKFNRNKYWIEPNQNEIDLSTQLILKNNSNQDANTVTKLVWSMSGADYTNILSIKDGKIIRSTSDKIDDVITVSVEIYQLDKDDTITLTTTLYATDHIAKPGDVIYPDGSFSDEYIHDDNPIGICFYVDENDSTNRLMFANGYALTGDSSTNYSWGMGFGSHSSIVSSAKGNRSPYTIAFAESGAYDLPSKNYNMLLPTPSYNSTTTFGSIFDESLDIYIDTNTREFKNHINYAIETLGFINSGSEDIKVCEKYGDSAKTIISKNIMVPIGLYNTVNIINTRNNIVSLDTYGYGMKTGIKWIEDEKLIPHKYDNKTELDALKEILQTVSEKQYPSNLHVNETTAPGESYEINTDASIDLYYPFASYCWAYEPNVLNLADKFKAHNWFLPTAGDATRIAYYLYCINNNNFSNTITGANNFSKFANIQTKSGITSIGDIITCTETNSNSNTTVFVNTDMTSSIFRVNKDMTFGKSSYSFSPTSAKGKNLTAGSGGILPICRF